VAPIWVEPNGANRIIVIPGANYGLKPEHGAAAVEAQEHLDIVIGQFEIEQAVTTAAFRAARERGATTLLNPAPAAPIDPDLAAVSDWIMPNEYEFAILARSVGVADDVADPAALAALAAVLGTRLLVTLGERGVALVGIDGEVSTIPTDTVTVVDTTGAGDAFVGAFAVGLASGWDEVEAARLGCAIAAESVQHPGTQTSFPDPERCAEIINGVRNAARAAVREGEDR
jgi:ribokinase